MIKPEDFEIIGITKRLSRSEAEELYPTERGVMINPEDITVRSHNTSRYRDSEGGEMKDSTKELLYDESVLHEFIMCSLRSIDQCRDKGLPYSTEDLAIAVLINKVQTIDRLSSNKVMELEQRIHELELLLNVNV